MFENFLKFIYSSIIVFIEYLFWLKQCGILIFENSEFFQFFLVFITLLVTSLLALVCILIYVAFITLYERKILGGIQKRKGPNVVGFLGLLQAISDGVKLFLKETLIPARSNTFLFIISPLIVFTLSLAGWALIPFFPQSLLSDLNLGLIILFALSIFNVYGILIAGWASNSRLPFLGALRSIAQMLAYDLSIGVNIMIVVTYAESFNLHDIIEFQGNYL